ncbi:MAG TPA: ATP-binding protein [Solirubrobacteraceae bacterium]|jgi:signal transduction histidine kinase|nr:ATP-binding protein [Solirubrobacteraceae bacterium]
MLAVALGGLAIVVADAHSRSRQELERAFYARPPIAAALFAGLLRGSVNAGSVPSNLTHGRVTASELRADRAQGGQRLTVYAGDGRLLAELAVAPGAPVPSVAQQRLVTDLAIKHGTSISSVLGFPPAASLDMATAYRTPVGERVMVTEFPLAAVSALLPGYMSAMVERGGEAFILDPAYRIIGTSDAGVAPGTVASDPALLSALAKHGDGGYARAGSPWHYASGTIPGTPWRIVLSVPDSTLYAPISSAVISWVLLALFALCGIVVLALVARSRRDADRLAGTYRELEVRNAEIEEATEAKSRFLASMSHELRTPLNGVIGFAELMHDGRVGEVSDRQREYLGDILASARHLLILINDVLDISKVEAGKLELHPELFDPARLVTEVQAGLRPLADDKEIVLEAHVDPDLEKVFTDPAKLRQILFNYVSNAIKFTAPRGRVEIRLAPSPHEDGMLRLEVEDSGVGIAPEDIVKLFVEFGQLKASTGRPVPGTGLGLAVTKRVVEAQGGSVDVRSVVGRGSVFSATLPYRSPVAPGYTTVDTGKSAVEERVG